MRQFILLLLLTITTVSFSQSRQTEYLEAKRQFNLGNYDVAKKGFQSLSTDEFFGSYSSFYFALSSFKQGEVKQATDMWKQIQIKNPVWNQKTEVDYWLATAYLSQEKYYEAFQYAEKLPAAIKTDLLASHFQDLSIPTMESAYALNPKNETIGSFLAQAISKEPYEKRDHLLLAELSEKFGLAIEGSKMDLPLIKKETYSVGVVLPFMFESVETPESVIRNTIIFDLYQGMQMAQKDLKRKNVSMELFPFDTQKSGEETRKILKNESLKSADVIIGPLYPSPNKEVSLFSSDNEITMVNPLSSNSSLIGNNSFSYLLKPSYETQGRIAAEFAASNFTRNNKALIFFETDRDSLVAMAYKEAIQRDSFFVVKYQRLTIEGALEVQRDYTEQYELRIDTLFNQDEIDSIALLPGRYVRNRVLRHEKTGQALKDSKGEDMLEYYELKFKVERDSIGHIFAATSSNLLVNNLISLVVVRSDTIGLIGFDSWLDFNLSSYDQLERIGAYMISTSFFNRPSFDFKRIEKDFVREIGDKPNQYHLTGYELIMQIGLLMKENGKYFQRGLVNGDVSKGVIMEGLKYDGYNDNQIVPIIQLEDFQLINKNNQIDRDSKNED